MYVHNELVAGYFLAPCLYLTCSPLVLFVDVLIALCLIWTAHSPTQFDEPGFGRPSLTLGVGPRAMGNEGSIPSDSESQVSDWQSLYSYGSKAGRRSSLGSMRIPSPMEPPEPDLSHLSPDEVAKIREVMLRAKEMKDEENKRIR